MPKWHVKLDRALFDEWRELVCQIDSLSSFVQTEDTVVADADMEQFHNAGRAANRKLYDLLKRTTRALRPVHAVRERGKFPHD